MEFGEKWNIIDSNRALSRREKTERKEALVQAFVGRYGIEYVFAHIPEIFGPGEARNLLLMLAFNYADKNAGYDKLVALAKTAGSPEERQFALAGVLQLMEFKGATAGDFESFLPLTKAEALDYSYTVESLVKGKSLSLEEGVRLLNSSDPELSSKRLTEFLQSIAIKNSKGVAEYCLANLSESPGVRNEALKACFYSEIDMNPAEGMAYAMKLKSENASQIDPFLITDCMTRFFLKDSRKAEEWLNLSVDSTTGAVHDALQAARSIHIAGDLDFAEARRILSEIQDPKVIQQTQQAIDRLEGQSLKGLSDQ
ncbi:hypothetical protein llg_20480 [Luteolibacter sp. LG18]|nr:hypothetical protein llg_20480 [Luteolibacter sp. LG18]